MGASTPEVVALREHLALDELTATLSDRFRDIPLPELDRVLETSLRDLGERLHLDRVHVGRVPGDGSVALSCHEWCAAGVAPPRPRGEIQPVGAMPWSLEPLRAGRTQAVATVEGLPPEAREEVAEFHPPGLRAFCLVPMTEHGTLVGWLGCDAVRDRRAWPTGVLELLRLAADVLSGAMERKQRYTDVCHALDRCRDAFDDLPLGVYRTTPGGRILYVNRTLMRMLGFESFQDLSRHPLTSATYAPSYPRQQFVQRIESVGEIRDLESSWTRKDGTPVRVREHARAVRGPEGVTRYYEGVVEPLGEGKPEAGIKVSEFRV